MVIKKLMLSQVTKYLLRLSIVLKIRNGFNRPYFKLSEGNPFYKLAINVLIYFS